MGTQSTLFWVNLGISTHKCDFMHKFTKSDIVRDKQFDATFCFIDNLCAVINGEEI